MDDAKRALIEGTRRYLNGRIAEVTEELKEQIASTPGSQRIELPAPTVVNKLTLESPEVNVHNEVQVPQVVIDTSSMAIAIAELGRTMMSFMASMQEYIKDLAEQQRQLLTILAESPAPQVEVNSPEVKVENPVSVTLPAPQKRKFKITHEDGSEVLVEEF